MLSRDVRVEDFAGPDWVRLVEILSPRPRAPRGGEPRQGGVVALTREARLVKLVSTTSGRIEIREHHWPIPLSDLARRHDARWAARLEVGALEALMDRWADRLRPEHDLSEQAVELLSVLRELETEGTIETWPRSLSRIPGFGDRAIQRALDVLCPDGKTLLFAAFEQGKVVTSVAAHRRGRAFDRIVGPEQLRRDMGLVSQDWTRDYRHLARATELGVGPLALGAFAEIATWERLAHDPSPGAWAAAVAARDVILHPVAPAIAIPLGLDVGRALISTVRELAQRLGESDLGPLGAALEPFRQAAAAERDMQDILGIDFARFFQGMIDEAHRRFGGRDGDG